MADGPAIRCKDQGQYEEVKLALASVRVQPGEERPTLKAFAPVLIDAGLRALALGGAPAADPREARDEHADEVARARGDGFAKGEEHVRATADAEIERLKVEIARVRADLATMTNDAERRESELARVIAERDEARTQSLTHASADALSTILAGASAAPKRGGGAPVNALDAVRRIMSREECDMPTAIALAAKHYDARLGTLADVAQKRKAGAA